jgi:hypothetical protein
MQARTFIRLAVALVGLSAVDGLADDGPAEEYSFDLARMPITALLNEFSKQTGLNISLVVSDDRKNLVIGPLKGRYTAESALDELLGGCGLVVKRVNKETIAIMMAEGARDVQPTPSDSCQQLLNLRNRGDRSAFQRA